MCPVLSNNVVDVYARHFIADEKLVLVPFKESRRWLGQFVEVIMTAIPSAESHTVLSAACRAIGNVDHSDMRILSDA